MKEFAKKIYWIVSIQFGFNPIRMIQSIRGIPRFFRDWLCYRKHYKGKIEIFPCLYDWYEEGGTTKDEYFWQDLYVAREINKANPVRHVDIGSRIDGFVAHVASFREVEVFDIRPITTVIPGVIFRQSDLMSSANFHVEYCDSLSCLHALEHFGLGRYGDPINVNGHVDGLKNMSRILKKGGFFYLSVPIGLARVAFNANKVFDPKNIVELAKTNGLELKSFAFFGNDRVFVESSSPKQDIEILSEQRYSLGIFTFIKQ